MCVLFHYEHYFFFIMYKHCFYALFLFLCINIVYYATFSCYVITLICDVFITISKEFIILPERQLLLVIFCIIFCGMEEIQNRQGQLNLPGEPHHRRPKPSPHTPGLDVSVFYKLLLSHFLFGAPLNLIFLPFSGGLRKKYALDCGIYTYFPTHCQFNGLKAGYESRTLNS